MNTVSANENAAADSLQRKSLLIIQARFQQALGLHAEAARLFLEAALLEERLAADFRRAGNDVDAAISLFSGASCYKQAGRRARAVALAEDALSLLDAGELAEEIRRFRDECRSAIDPTGGRTLRGIVRNGTVHPFESGVLAEGETVTITTV